MANEFKHKDPGSELTQNEFIASDGTGHIFESQAQGDILYATSTTELARLGKGTNGNILHQASCAPAWTASPSFTGLTLSGALDVNGTIDYDGTDVDMLSSGDIDLVSSNDAAAAVYIAQSTGTSGTVKIHADTGTSVTEGAESINILSDVGGIGLRSTANLAKAINIMSDGGTTGTISIFNDQGTAVNEGVASIQLLSDVGGIGIKSGLNAAGAIRLTADAGTSETIILHADQGNGTDSIHLLSDAGGITLNPGTFVTIGGIADGEIRLFEDTGAGCNYAAIKVQNMSASYTLTLPADDGCACEVLTTNGSGVLDWSAAGGGNLVLINTAEAACSGTLDITGLDSTYDTYMIALSDVTPKCNDQLLLFRVGDSSGVDSGSCDYAWNQQILSLGNSTYDAENDSGAAYIQIAGDATNGGLGNGAGKGAGAVLWLHRPGDGTMDPLISGTYLQKTAGGGYVGGTVIGSRTSVITLDRVQILFDAGNIATGRMTVWGVKHA